MDQNIKIAGILILAIVIFGLCLGSVESFLEPKALKKINGQIRDKYLEDYQVLRAGQRNYARLKKEMDETHQKISQELNAINLQEEKLDDVTEKLANIARMRDQYLKDFQENGKPDDKTNYELQQGKYESVINKRYPRMTHFNDKLKNLQEQEHKLREIINKLSSKLEKVQNNPAFPKKLLKITEFGGPGGEENTLQICPFGSHLSDLQVAFDEERGISAIQGKCSDGTQLAKHGKGGDLRHVFDGLPVGADKMSFYAHPNSGGKSEFDGLDGSQDGIKAIEYNGRKYGFSEESDTNKRFDMSCQEGGKMAGYNARNNGFLNSLTIICQKEDEKEKFEDVGDSLPKELTDKQNRLRVAMNPIVYC